MKINRIPILAMLILISLLSFKSDKPAYKLFNSEGKEVKYSKMLKDIADADIVFFGELHNNPIAHWLELEITKDLYQIKNDSLILAAEMFERDDQLIIDEYLSGLYAASKFEPEVKLWKNYTTDYKPLMQFASDHNLYFIASNVPRRYASVVSKKGFEVLDSLSNQALTYFAPLPFDYDPELKCYKDMLTMMGEGDNMAHVNENLPKAQALKDVTMAYSISEYWSSGKLVIHYNGSYHSRNFEGIIWYLNRFVKDLKIVTLETVSQLNISELEEEYSGVASYIFAVPSSMTKTY
jgi:uncharacterized iron-regulated protein